MKNAISFMQKLACAALMIVMCQTQSLRADQAAEKGKAFAGAYKLYELQREPVLIESVPALYPYSAKKERKEGDAVVELCIEKNGSVRHAFVKTATDPRFGQAVVEAVKQWKFKPGTIDGKPVRAIVEQPYDFRLAD